MKLFASAFLSTLVVFFASCRDQEPRDQEPLEQRKPATGDARRPVDPEPENLLDYARGVVVTTRSGELNLDSSALHAIDGDPETLWSTPPRDPQQSLRIALPALTEITSLGFSSSKAVNQLRGPKRIQFEGSLDDSRYFPLVTAMSAKLGDNQLYPTPPTPVRFLRVSILEGLAPSSSVDVASLHLRGKEIAPSPASSLTGRWKLNESSAQFRQTGARVDGVVELEEQPMHIAGGTNGRLVRFVWVRGPQYGYGAVAVTPESKRLSGMWWFEDCNPYHFGAAWFGEKLPDGGIPRQTTAVLEHFLGITGRFPLYGVLIGDDDQVDVKGSEDALKEIVALIATSPERRLRFIASEFRSPTTVENKKRSERQIASFLGTLRTMGADVSRISFAAAGDDPRGKPAVSTKVQRAVYSTIELVDDGWEPAVLAEFEGRRIDTIPGTKN